MKDPATLRRHAALVDRMATRLGIDLEESVLHGELEFGELAEVVIRCTDCSNPEGCKKWLDSQPSVKEDMPDYCVNKETLKALQP